MIIYDQFETKMIHYQTDEKDNMQHIFKKCHNNEFYSNKDVTYISIIWLHL